VHDGQNATPGTECPRGYAVTAAIQSGTPQDDEEDPSEGPRAVTSDGYGGNVVSRVSSTGPPTVKW